MIIEKDDFESFVVENAPEQRLVGGVRVPSVLSPPSSSSSSTTTTTTAIKDAKSATAWVRSNRSAIDSKLAETGAVLFRGFPLETAEDFDAFVEGGFAGWEDLSYERSMSFAVRKRQSNRICTTNEGKSGGLVFHHEQAQTPLWPSHVFFCCLLPAQPGDGGETGLTPSDVVYSKLKEKYPGFIEKCETVGVRYTIYAGPEQDPTRGAGRSWKSFFHVGSKEDCERKMEAGGWAWEWGVGPNNSTVPSDHLKFTTPLMDAVKIAPGTANRKVFFNQLICTPANAVEFSNSGAGPGGGYDPARDQPSQEGVDACVRFGDGTPISLDILLDAKKMCEESAIDISWQKGDVALISNYLMMHARRPWNGPDGSRKLLASLVAEPNCTSFGKPLVAL